MFKQFYFKIMKTVQTMTFTVRVQIVPENRNVNHQMKQ
jgi:hypothetical protein